jgi:hypothetical protein
VRVRVRSGSVLALPMAAAERVRSLYSKVE